MARIKGSPKTGGRQKGTQNKTTTVTKQVIASLLSDYNESGLMAKDFKELEPKDRLIMAHAVHPAQDAVDRRRPLRQRNQKDHRRHFGRTCQRPGINLKHSVLDSYD